jgi:hypothetical protein
MLVEKINAQLLGPPIPVRRTAASGVIDRTFRFVRHSRFSLGWAGAKGRFPALPVNA